MSQIIEGNSLELLRTWPVMSVDVVITSPRYNFGKNYPGVNDKTTHHDYLEEIYQLARGCERVVREDGALFVNIGTNAANPLHDLLVAQQFQQAGWVLQERFVWQKATEDGIGHFTPIHSNYHVNNLWESIFLFTKTGKVELDRLAIGVPYKDQTNIKRWKHGRAVHCRGDVWLIPYDTITNRGKDRQGHEATFPRELVIRCLRLIEHGRDNLRVLDPCCGTGTVPIVAHEQGHIGIGVELSPEIAGYAREALDKVLEASA
jgi:site-specific DNA-methyltransferase (adenine-specific)